MEVPRVSEQVPEVSEQFPQVLEQFPLAGELCPWRKTYWELGAAFERRLPWSSPCAHSDSARLVPLDKWVRRAAHPELSASIGCWWASWPWNAPRIQCIPREWGMPCVEGTNIAFLVTGSDE